jgi:hypothetical protein
MVEGGRREEERERERERERKENMHGSMAREENRAEASHFHFDSKLPGQS